MRKAREMDSNHLYVSMKHLSIDELSITWKNKLTIILVLDGEINITVDNEDYILTKGSIEIINPNELHSIIGKKKNRVLIFDIDPDFFQMYYKEAKKTLYYIDEDDDANDEKYSILKEYIVRILFETITRMDDSEDAIINNLLKLQYHLLNNFHYLYYEKEYLKEDDEELQRFHRITKYLQNNYMQKVNLKDLADREFLNPSYLSFKIKDIMGITFQQYLNEIRVEKSTKLLISSDKSISEIALDVGFSHPRYYKKFFKEHYEIDVNEYRDKYKIEESKTIKKFKVLSLRDVLEDLKQYLINYERYGISKGIEIIHIDLNQEKIGEFEFCDTMNFGDSTTLLEEDNIQRLIKVQRELSFKKGFLYNLFSEDLDIYKGKNQKFINWTRVEFILETLFRNNIEPIIYIKGVKKSVLDSFVDNFSEIFDQDVEKWFVEEELENIIKPNTVDPEFDSSKIVPKIIENHVHNNNPPIPSFMDEINKETELTNDTFFGGPGLFTLNGLSKASYYAFMFLSYLGEEVLYIDKQCICTKKDDEIQILVYNLSEDGKGLEKKININLLNINDDYRISKFKLDFETGSVYEKWMELGSPERIGDDHWDLLNEFVHPKISFYYKKKSRVFPIFTKVKENGAVLYLLKVVH